MEYSTPNRTPGSLSEIPQKDKNALIKIRKFSILSIIGYSLDTISIFILLYYIFSIITKSLNSSSSIIQYEFIDSYVFIFAETVSLVAAVLLFFSFVYLRSGYGLLRNSSNDFKSPYIGTNLFFIGLIITIIGSIVILYYLIIFHPSTSSAFGAIIGLSALAIIGGILSFIGEIMALIIGSYDLKDYFKKDSFGTAGIMFIIGIFIPLFNLIGAILIYTASTSLLK